MERPEDDLERFGEGFDGFPKRLADDCVEYMLFIPDSRLTQREALTRLELVRNEALSLTGTLLQDYIWQRDEFRLKLRLDVPGHKYLYGLSNYGDSVEDEWLIVYLLRELSKKFPDLWIKVADTDGEFLLIEAANVLPRWLNPEIADNRVWINDGNLRIIPPAASVDPASTKTTSVSRPLAIVEAQERIARSPQDLIHSPLIEAEAFYRLKAYPSQISNSLHYARITIPRKLAFFLHKTPSSIAPAVEAFYLRDPIALKPLQAPDSSLSFPPEDVITATVKFTRVLYAQLKSQGFTPPVAWKAHLLEAERRTASDATAKTAFARTELGMKVTSGFEMLLKDPKYKNNSSVRKAQILLEDLEDGEVLPSDSEIALWKDSDREDSEAWLDINFEDFEKELAGKAGTSNTGPKGVFGPELASGFGDAKTQADLKKIVSRFEAFLNDENAGIDGAEMDDTDLNDGDDDDEPSDEDSSDDEDKEVSFDEQEFARMMREMMGMPSEDIGAEAAEPEIRKGLSNAGRVQELNNDGEDDESSEEQEMRKVMARIETELKDAGILSLDSGPNLKVGTAATAKQTKSSDHGGEDPESDIDRDIDIDFNLAKNMLESFKSQAGMAGPGGNLMGMMGMQLPRDEGDEGEGRGPKPHVLPGGDESRIT
ncbi:MAG: hypothetical protein M1818_007863 [Claussenomyces sp. TS43310]|nr:MAG: hypothetical protein M1818_007863 [Claussenomyces sp. TS43310]